ncbi:DUF6056 family protein [Spirosoma fluviale]|uniref:4-amino-4-deoxy-L-arabinose transferase n=1 Tax=Spirosoma fluviale TaxID=1597977 RepID=A0A286F8I2_9BACT|nr:DUF6056 family protein [Spirosoma fluviale]SOD79525.1 hypothetical protein SAMN06269250_0988 [Spirosoma fluviale]
MKHPLIDRLATVIVILLFLVAYLPLVLLSFHNHPSAADDYCFADTALKYGFWQAQKFYYDGWTGRYFSNMLVHGSPLVWGWYDGYRFIPALMATALVGAIYALVSELLRTESLINRVTATCLLFFLVVLSLQSTVEAFFWTAAIATYTVPTILTIYLIAVLIGYNRLPNGPIKWLTTVWASFLVFAIIGSGETNLVLLILLLLAITGYRLVFLRKVDPLMMWLVLVSFVSAWVLFQAPGNAIRMGSNEAKAGELFPSIARSFSWLARSIAFWLLKTPILPFTLLFVTLARRATRQGSPVRDLFMVPAGLLTVVYLGLLAAMIFPSYYGLGIAPYARTMNILFVFFVLGWFYVATVWVGWLDRRGRSLTIAQKWPAPVWFLTGIWLIGSVGASSAVNQLYADWLSGRAATYDREMTERHQQLLTSADTVRLRPISVYPPSLFVEDVKPDRTHWWNRCQSGYYGHKALVLDSTLTANR